MQMSSDLHVFVKRIAAYSASVYQQFLMTQTTNFKRTDDGSVYGTNLSELIQSTIQTVLLYMSCSNENKKVIQNQNDEKVPTLLISNEQAKILANIAYKSAVFNFSSNYSAVSHFFDLGILVSLEYVDLDMRSYRYEITKKGVQWLKDNEFTYSDVLSKLGIDDTEDEKI